MRRRPIVRFVRRAAKAGVVADIKPGGRSRETA